MVVGSGNWGKNLVKNYYELDSLYGVCESDKAKQEELKNKYPNIKIWSNYDELLEDKSVNGIVIATPAQTHFELAEKSLNAGFPTYVEKPLTLNIKEAQKLSELAESKNLQLMVGHILEYFPAMTKIKELIENNVLGKIKHIRCTRVNLGKIRSYENIWWSFAPHDLSIISMFVDKEPVEVKVSSFKPLQEGIEDTVYADLIFEDGVSAHIHVSWLEPNKLHQTVVIGEKAMVVYNDTASEDKIKLYEYTFDKENVSLVKKSEKVIEFDDSQPLRIECQHFIDCIKNNTKPKTDGFKACKIIKIMEQVDKQLKKE